MFVKDGRFWLVEGGPGIPAGLGSGGGELIMGSSGPLWINGSTLDSFGSCITNVCSLVV